MIGATLRNGVSIVLDNSKGGLIAAYSIFLFFMLIIYLTINLLGRLREDIFLIADLNGAYQRSGNFLSISFLILSIMVLIVFVKYHELKRKKIQLAFWFLLYGSCAVFALICSQLFGSNSATGVVLGVFFCTLVVIFLLQNQRLNQLHSHGQLMLPFGKSVLASAVYFSVCALALIGFCIIFIQTATDYDFKSINLFGFGDGTINSIASRMEILRNAGVDQIGYAPLFGNMNVSYLTTGESGRTLHSFFLFVFANLGLVGLFGVMMLFFLILFQLYRSVKYELLYKKSIYYSLIYFYYILIFLFILIFANLTVGVDWPVLWFVVGFVSCPFSFKYIAQCNGDSRISRMKGLKKIECRK